MKVLPIALGAGIAYLAIRNVSNKWQALQRLSYSNPKVKVKSISLLNMELEMSLDIINSNTADLTLDYFTGIVNYQGKQLTTFTFNANGKNTVIEGRKTTTIPFTLIVKNIQALGTIVKLISAISAGKTTSTIINVDGILFAAGFDVPVKFDYDIKAGNVVKSTSVKGIGGVKDLSHLIPAVKLRITRGKKSSTDKVKTPADSAEIFKKFIGINKIETQEIVAVMYLNQANIVLGVYTTSVGGITSAVADPRLILAGALSLGAVKLILCHNHPSGNLFPSKADINLTNSVSQAARMMSIEVLDHVIITKESYYSLGENGDI